VNWPAAEVNVDEHLVRELLREQHADLADLPLRYVDAGFDNAMWRLGDGLLVRLPRRRVAVTLTENEQRWLPELAPLLPLAVPAPARIGRPSEGYPWPWSVLPWLQGLPGDRAPVTDPVDAGRSLGRFLRALHKEAPASAPINHWRGVPLVERADTFEQRLNGLGAEVDTGQLSRVWEAALRAHPHRGHRVWIHGDLHPANLLIAEGTVVAVIDFGDLCGGDPATDVAGALMVLPAEGFEAFKAEYPRIDSDGLRRAYGWAALFGLMLLELGRGDRPTYYEMARLALERTLAGPPR
jgi:aminoglycoside phosphotransferase (APT) family kinase protein